LPSLTLVNPRGTTQTANQLAEFEHWIRRGYTPQDGSTVAAGRTLFTGQPETPTPLDPGVSDTELAALKTVLGAGHNPKLRRWYAGLAGRYAAPARVLVIGDSISEGTGSTAYARRWQSLLQSQLRGRFQPPGAVGAAIPYITASPRVVPLPTGLGLTSSGAITQASFGLGLRAATVGAGMSLTFTFTGDRCKLMAAKSSSAGRLNIAVDGAAGTVVDTFQSGNAVGGFQVWDSGALTRGAHTVVVTRDASTTTNPGNVFPEGLLTFDGDHDAGVRVVDAARHGSTLATFTASAAWAGAVTNTGPYSLLVMPWGANDSTSGTSAATFAANLATLIGQVRGAGFTGSILLVGLDKRQTATEALWSSYLAALQAAADADPDIAYLDLRSRMPDVGTAEAVALGLYADDVHPSDKGHGWIADQIATAIMPR
jgi:lysophospholipase L1-like esterase